MHGFHLNVLRLLHVCDAEVFHCDCTHGLASSEQRSMSRLATGRGMNNASFVTGLINPASCLTYAELASLVRARGVFEVRKRTTQPCSHFINDHLVPGLMYVPWHSPDTIFVNIFQKWLPHKYILEIAVKNVPLFKFIKTKMFLWGGGVDENTVRGISEQCSWWFFLDQNTVTFFTYIFTFNLYCTMVMNHLHTFIYNEKIWFYNVIISMVIPQNIFRNGQCSLKLYIWEFLCGLTVCRWSSSSNCVLWLIYSVPEREWD